MAFIVFLLSVYDVNIS
jgi:carboxypeptidase C (cathepsin A)